MNDYGRKEKKLQALLDEAGVRYFSARELLYLGGSHYDRMSKAYGKNRLCPDGFLPNIVDAASALDQARDELGAPVIVLSAYRDPDYNRAVGGEKGSYHLRFFAIDATPRDPSKKRLDRLVAILKRNRAQGGWTGGLGVYSGFVHVDCGTAHNRSW